MNHRRPQPLLGTDGELYYTIGDAAKLLGIDRGALDRDPTIVKVAAGIIAALPITRGRPPTVVVSAEEVNRRREKLLDELFAIDRLAAGEATSAAVQQRLDQLTTANIKLEAHVRRLEDALRLSLVVDGARVDQLRGFLTPEPRDI